MTPNEPFLLDKNSSGIAVLVRPDGELHCVPMVAICPAETGPPYLLMWVNDSVANCDRYPGFICAWLPYEGWDDAALCSQVRSDKDCVERIENWMVRFEESRRQQATRTRED